MVAIGGVSVEPGRSAQVDLPVARLATHTMLDLPLTVVNGARDGARVWLSATLHGDELNGMEIIRRVLTLVEPAAMSGLLVAAPIVNVFGFIQQSRYLPDRRDLNRSFPGSARGSLAARMAHLLMTEVVSRCTHGIDLHTAAPPRINLPQIRGDLADPETRRCAEAFAAPVMIHGVAAAGTLRHAARRRGIPVLLYEAGEPLRFNDDAIEVGVAGVLRVLAALGMIEAAPAGSPSVEAIRARWVRAPQSGVIYLETALGRSVDKRELLARISDPMGSAAVEVRAPFPGLVIGHTNNPLVHRGDGIIHVGVVHGGQASIECQA